MGARGTPRTPAFLPAQGRQRDGPRQHDPPPHWPPRPRSRGARRTDRPPPSHPLPPRPPGLERPRRADPPHGERTAQSQVGGKRDRAAPPRKQAKRSTGPRQDARRGTDCMQRSYQRPAPGPHEVRAPHQPGEGGGEDAAGARAHTRTKDTRGIPEGQPDRARGTHSTSERASERVKDTRTGRPATHSAGHTGREGGHREDKTPGTGPRPPYRLRAPRTQDQNTAPAKAVVAHRAAHQPQG